MKTDRPGELPSLARRVATLAVTPRRWPKVLFDVLRFVYHRIQRLGNRIYVYGSYGRSLLRRRTDFVEERWRGVPDLAAASRIAVFTHYDGQGVVHDFVAHYIRQLTEAGFTVIFVSNSPNLPEATIARLLPLCALVLRRANVGYDFGALKDGIAQIPSLDRVDTLLIANDSVYGPFHPLREVLARMDLDAADAWGITDSWEHRFHLQSFFLLFGRRAVQSPAFARFWSAVRYVQAKDWIIERYEIGLTKALTDGGLRCQALYPYERAAAALLATMSDGDPTERVDLDLAQRKFVDVIYSAACRGVPLNVTHYYWDYLVERMGCPFLKRELLRQNPMRIPFVGRWEEVVASASAYDTSLVARHLAATLGGHPVPDPMPAGLPRRTWYA